MDPARLGRGEMIAAVSGAVLLIVMFLSWFGAPDTVDAGGIEFDIGDAAGALGVDTTANAWQAFSFIDIVLFLTAVVSIGLGVATAMSRDVAMPVAASALVAGLGIVSTLLVLYRVIDPVEGASREFGLFLGLLAAGGVAYGGWVSMQEEGSSFGAQAENVQDRYSGGGGAPPPPPPPQAPPPQGGPPPQGPAA